LEEPVPKRVYLANPYGFSLQQRSLLLPPLVQALEQLGAEVWEPFARNNQIDFSQPGWAYKVAQADLKDVITCDGIFAVVNGTPPDEGVMVELGVAIALNKAIFLFRDDFRRCTDSEQYPLNLMIFAGLSETRWEDHYYTSIEEIGSSHKALYEWLQS
jgi:nucleoside 2-deoxyribosyltransferase